MLNADFPRYPKQGDTFVYDGGTYTYHELGVGWYIDDVVPQDEKDFNWVTDYNKSLINGQDKFVVRRYPLNPQLDAIKDMVRVRRTRLIEELDWRYLRNARETRLGRTPTDDITKLDTYAQALADIPSQEGFPTEVIWPTL
jgi:hypothetical protein